MIMCLYTYTLIYDIRILLGTNNSACHLVAFGLCCAFYCVWVREYRATRHDPLLEGYDNYYKGKGSKALSCWPSQWRKKDDERCGNVVPQKMELLKRRRFSRYDSGLCD